MIESDCFLLWCDTIWLWLVGSGKSCSEFNLKVEFDRYWFGFQFSMGEPTKFRRNFCRYFYRSIDVDWISYLVPFDFQPSAEFHNEVHFLRWYPVNLHTFAFKKNQITCELRVSYLILWSEQQPSKRPDQSGTPSRRMSSSQCETLSRISTTSLVNSTLRWNIRKYR